ncbi:hypothetical protein [Craterilacuibacter sp.]|uniref:hypothetical protein n=1 Tax=Craterilacuibacter sp. TaxID=2870909 RepID=UPI003F368587
MLDAKIDSNTYLDRFFRHFKSTEAQVKDNIYRELPQIIQHRPHKIKIAKHLKRNGRLIYEYKVALGHNINYRAAYTQDDQGVTVFFISDTLIKREFVKLLGNTSLVD